MTKELKVLEDENDEYKLRLKKKAISKVDAKYHHAKIYVESKVDYDRDARHMQFENILNDHKYLATYFDEQNAVDTFRVEVVSGSKAYGYSADELEWEGKAFRAASKTDLEKLYQMLFDKLDVEYIVNFMFELLNIYRVLPKLNVGNLSKTVQKQTRKFQREQKRKMKTKKK
eukprot:497307_1